MPDYPITLVLELKVGQRIRVNLVVTNVELGFIDFVPIDWLCRSAGVSPTNRPALRGSAWAQGGSNSGEPAQCNRRGQLRVRGIDDKRELSLALVERLVCLA